MRGHWQCHISLCPTVLPPPTSGEDAPTLIRCCDISLVEENQASAIVMASMCSFSSCVILVYIEPSMYQHNSNRRPGSCIATHIYILIRSRPKLEICDPTISRQAYLHKMGGGITPKEEKGGYCISPKISYGTSSAIKEVQHFFTDIN